MAFPQGSVSFPGIPDDAIVAGDYTRGHGISPGTATLTVHPNTKVSEGIGTLTFSYGNVKLELKGCAIISGRAQASPSQPTLWQIRIQDRRWAWQYTSIDGRYNARKKDGETSDLDTSLYKEKTPRELAKLLLEAMGEKGYDVSKLPDETRPAIVWEGARADVELEELCESLGCRVVYCLDDKVRICKIGEGKNLPLDDNAMNLSVGHERAALPGKIRADFQPTTYEAKWELEAVGEETTGEIEPIDELSYKPTGGWGVPDDVDDEKVYSRDFDGTEKLVIDLARKTVFRYFRIKKLLGKPDRTLSPDGKIKGSIFQVFLNDHLVATDSNGKHLPAVVEGQFSSDRFDTAGYRSAEGTPWPGGFSIDRDRRLVILSSDGEDFGAYDTDTDDDETIVRPKLILHTSYTLHGDNGATSRLRISRTLSKNPGTKDIGVDHLGLVVRQLYTAPRTLGKLKDNRDTVHAEADKILDLEEKRLKPAISGDVQYNGIRKDIELDGAISQVTIRVGGLQPCTMRVGRNNEPVLSQPSYEERRRIAREAAAKKPVTVVAAASRLAGHRRDLGIVEMPPA